MTHTLRDPVTDLAIDLATHSILGWPREITHSCGARAAMLSAVYPEADYECRGTPTEEWSAYGPDRCGKVFVVVRANADTLDELVDFDRPFYVSPEKTLEFTEDIAPDILDDELSDEGWEFVTGYSGQHGYSGPIMHSSEFFGGRMAQDVLDRPGVYAITAAHYSPDEDDDTEETIMDGWALLRRKESA
jgi:hypothetical protein